MNKKITRALLSALMILECAACSVIQPSSSSNTTTEMKNEPVSTPAETTGREQEKTVREIKLEISERKEETSKELFYRGYQNKVSDVALAPADFAICQDGRIVILDSGMTRLQFYKDGAWERSVALPLADSYTMLLADGGSLYLLGSNALYEVKTADPVLKTIAFEDYMHEGFMVRSFIITSCGPTLLYEDGTAWIPDETSGTLIQTDCEVSISRGNNNQQQIRIGETVLESTWEYHLLDISEDAVWIAFYGDQEREGVSGVELGLFDVEGTLLGSSFLEKELFYSPAIHSGKNGTVYVMESCTDGIRIYEHHPETEDILLEERSITIQETYYGLTAAAGKTTSYSGSPAVQQPEGNMLLTEISYEDLELGSEDPAEHFQAFAWPDRVFGSGMERINNGLLYVADSGSGRIFRCNYGSADYELRVMAETDALKCDPDFMMAGVLENSAYLISGGKLIYIDDKAALIRSDKAPAVGYAIRNYAEQQGYIPMIVGLYRFWTINSWTLSGADGTMELSYDGKKTTSAQSVFTEVCSGNSWTVSHGELSWMIAEEGLSFRILGTGIVRLEDGSTTETLLVVESNAEGTPVSISRYLPGGTLLGRIALNTEDWAYIPKQFAVPDEDGQAVTLMIPGETGLRFEMVYFGNDT